MDQNDVRLLLFQHRGDLLQDRLGDIKQSLPLLHDGQIIVRLHMKCPHHLLQHGFMLAGGAHHGGKLLSALEFVDQGTHFDGFRPGAEHQHYLFTHFFHLCIL